MVPLKSFSPVTMATASGIPSADDGSLISLLGQEFYEDYFGTGEDANSAVGGAADADENRACTLESLVDSLLLQASHAFEMQKQNHDLLSQNQRKMWQTLEELVY